MIGPSFADILWIVFFGALTAGAALLSRLKFGDAITPLSIFVGMTSLSVSAYHLHLVGFIEVSVATHVVIVGAFLAFFVGWAVVPGIPAGEPRHRDGVDSRGLAAFFYITALISFVGWSIALYLLASRHTLAGLLSRPWLLQDEFQMRFVGYLNLLGIVVLPACAMKWVLGRRRAIDVVAVASALWGLFLAGIKTYLVLAVVMMALTLTALRARSIRVKHLLVGGILGLCFFVYYQRTIDVFVVPTARNSWFLQRLDWLEMPYLYLAGPFAAAERIVGGGAPEQPISAYVTLQPVWKLLGDGLHFIRPVPPYLPFVPIGDGVIINVYGLVGEVVWDLGVAGALAVIALIALATTALYGRARQRGSWPAGLLYGIAACPVVLSFFLYFYRFELFVLLVWAGVLGGLLRLQGFLKQPEGHTDD